MADISTRERESSLLNDFSRYILIPTCNGNIPIVEWSNNALWTGVTKLIYEQTYLHKSKKSNSNLRISVITFNQNLQKNI